MSRCEFDQVDVNDMFEYLPFVAREINGNLIEAGFDKSMSQARQVIALNEEVGEFTGAWRRYAGMARRSGSRVDVEKELADVIITAFMMADVLSIGSGRLKVIIYDKLKEIYSRGWVEPKPCRVYWGSHGCTLERGHDGHHQCGCADDNYGPNVTNVGKFPYYGPETKFYGEDVSRETEVVDVEQGE